MRRTARLATTLCAAFLVASLATPIANAAPVGGNGGCLSRQGAVGRSTGHMTRDEARTTGADKLSGWLPRPPPPQSDPQGPPAPAPPPTDPGGLPRVPEETTPQ